MPVPHVHVHRYLRYLIQQSEEKENTVHRKSLYQGNNGFGLDCESGVWSPSESPTFSNL